MLNINSENRFGTRWRFTLLAVAGVAVLALAIVFGGSYLGLSLYGLGKDTGAQFRPLIRQASGDVLCYEDGSRFCESFFAAGSPGERKIIGYLGSESSGADKGQWLYSCADDSAGTVRVAAGESEKSAQCSGMQTVYRLGFVFREPAVDAAAPLYRCAAGQAGGAFLTDRETECSTGSGELLGYAAGADGTPGEIIEAFCESAMAECEAGTGYCDVDEELCRSGDTGQKGRYVPDFPDEAPAGEPAEASDADVFFSQSLPDGSEALPGDKVYPDGKRFPFAFFQMNAEEDLPEGVTMYGPFGGKEDKINAAKRQGAHAVIDIGFLKFKDMTEEQIRKGIREQVEKFVDNPEVAWWSILPGELRGGRVKEKDYLRTVSGIIREVDGELNRPIWMYEPNHRGPAALSNMLEFQDISGKGMYTNLRGLKNARISVRASVEQELEAIRMAGSDAVPIAVLEMFKEPEAGDADKVPAWARHDAYLALASGAKGIVIYKDSSWIREEFTQYGNYRAAYLKVAKELNGEAGLGDVFLFSEPRDDIKVRIMSGPPRVAMPVASGFKYYSPVTVFNGAYRGDRYLFLVNSAVRGVTAEISGLPGSGFAAENLFSGDDVTREIAGGKMELAMEAYGVAGIKLLAVKGEGSDEALTAEGESPDEESAEDVNSGAGSGAQVLFVTRNNYAVGEGGFVGISGADQVCMQEAKELGFSGSFRAVLSDSNTNASDRLKIAGEVRNEQGALMANDAKDLWDGSISRAASIGAGKKVFSGTRHDGGRYRNDASFFCGNWAQVDDGSIAISASYVPVGMSDKSNSGWIYQSYSSCSVPSALYCISQ